MGAPAPREIHTKFAAALNAGDLEAVCALYEPLATIVPQPGQAPVQGIDGIRKVLAGFISMGTRIDIETVWAVECGELALLRSRHHLIAKGTGGQPVEMIGSGSAVLRRQPDGGWLYVIDHAWGAG